MKRLLSLFGWAALAILGCGSETVGDPCAPQRPGGQPCVVSGGMGSAGCFSGSEIYIETQSLQCQSRICLVYQYAEASNVGSEAQRAARRAEHVYCTCRCGVPPSLSGTSQDVLCTCPENYSCVSIAGEQYNEGVRGSYCVRTSTVGAGGSMSGSP